MSETYTSAGYAGGLRIEKVVTSGIFALDGGEWEVDNNIWILGDDSEVYVIDAAHTAAPIIDAVAGREVKGILCSHAHNDHITVAPELSATLDAPILVHPGDQMLWDETHPDVTHGDLSDGLTLEIAGTRIDVMNTPGHSPGSCVFHVPEAGVLFSGDTLFSGGPGATGRSYSDFPTIITSIRDRILTLPAGTLVHTGHGDGTKVGDESPHLEEWIRRGH
ncbi:MAG: MBL fold metallo-hydrolase [Actinomycetales bacterium]|nr:MBL fold metallo-hydrolase [Actinomycetales bacterium]